MKNLINQIWIWLVERNVARLANEFRSRGDVEAFTVLEVVLVSGLVVSGCMLIYFWMLDCRAGKWSLAIKKAAGLKAFAERDKAEIQRRLTAELEFAFAPEPEHVEAGELEDFFATLYEICPELKPDFPR